MSPPSGLEGDGSFSLSTWPDCSTAGPAGLCYNKTTQTSHRYAEWKVLVYIMFCSRHHHHTKTTDVLSFHFCILFVNLTHEIFPISPKKEKKRGISIAGLFLWQTPTPPPFDPGNKNQLFFVMWIVAWSSSPPTPIIISFHEVNLYHFILFYWNYDESFFFSLMGEEFFVRQTAKSQRKRVAHWQKSELLICVFFFVCKFTLFINAYLLLENTCWWNAVIFPEYLPLNLKEPCDFQHSPWYIFYINKTA